MGHTFRVFLSCFKREKDILSFSEEFHYLSKVIRVKQGDVIEIVRDKMLYILEILNVDIKGRIICGKILREMRINIPKSGVSVAISILKNDMFDAVSMLCQLGIDCVIPMITRNTVRIPKDRKRFIERLNSIAKVSAQQAKLMFIPAVFDITSYDLVLKLDFPLRLMGTLMEQAVHISRFSYAIKGNETLLIIGPEADFTRNEIERAISKDVELFKLNNSVLKSNTAAISIASIVQFIKGNL